MCILVVEDDVAVRAVLEAAIEDEGHTVALAGDGVEALSVAHARCPDLILIDLNMPRLDGEAFCHAYRERGGLAPVIVVSAAHPENIEAVIEACGAVGYIPKPFDLDHLLDTITRHLPPGSSDDRVRA